ncbi:BTAD domain-containing putative transcriptional regulator [Promicromonospora aerolata]|uniref:BTAD domain-containing putative transcriptional regulator n=1 Tax=Promicromonospora aerolata TaxID=195749 RepID=A0ABW4V8X0_9MICO
MSDPSNGAPSADEVAGAPTQVRIGVLGPVTAWVDGAEAPLGGPRQRAVLARLVAARGRVVTTDQLVDDLWERPPRNALVTLRTFVAALRRGLEPGRTARTPARLLVTDGPGYALRDVAVDAWSFEAAVSDARDLVPAAARAALERALDSWRGTPYAALDQPWAAAERARLTELHLVATERHAEARIALGAPADVVPDLDAHVAEHPWREESWRLLALALYRSGRQAESLAVLRRARAMLTGELGVDPGQRLRELETQVLRQEAGSAPAPDDVWRDTASAYERVVAAGAPSRLESTATLLRALALAGGAGLAAARSQRVAAVRAAEQLSDLELTARVIGAFDVPGAWTRSDDPGLAAELVATAERTLAALPASAPDAVRSRLLATVAGESRGRPGPRGPEAARQAEALARRSGDPAVLAFALAGRYLTSFGRAGLARERDAIGTELVDLAVRHGLSTFEVLGHLVRMQALSALGQWDAAHRHADAAAALGRRHERPLVDVFTRWFAAMRTAASGAEADIAERAYREATKTLDGSGMPGLADGLLPLALLALRVWRGVPAEGASDGGGSQAGVAGGGSWGPYEPWARPHLLLARGADADAAAAVRRIPDPPPDLLTEVLWILAGRAAVEVGGRRVAERAVAALTPAADEVSAGSGVLTAGPVGEHLRALTQFLAR